MFLFAKRRSIISTDNVFVGEARGTTAFQEIRPGAGFKTPAIPLQLETRFWGQNYLDLVQGGVRGLSRGYRTVGGGLPQNDSLLPHLNRELNTQYCTVDYYTLY